jgi:hypothetical protein
MQQIMQSKDSTSIAAALRQFRAATKQEQPMECLMPGIKSFLPDPEYCPKYKLEDCSEELAYLVTFTNQFAEHLLRKQCDQSKLAHVLSLLSSRNGSAMERDAVVRLFKGEFSTAETGESLKIKAQVNEMVKWLHDQNPFNE